MAAVAEAALEGQLGDVGEGGLDTLGGPGHAKRSDPGGVDEERAARQADKLAVRGRVAAAGVVLADGGRPLALRPHQRVDERGLAGPGRPEHDRGAATTEVCGPELLDPVAGQRRHGPHLDAGRHGLGRDPQAIHVAGEVRLVEEDDGCRTTAPGHREVALEAAEVEIAVQARDDERHVHVGGEHLVVGQAQAPAPVGVGGIARERGPARQDRLDDGGVVTGLDGDPVADRGQVARAERLVPEAARDDGVTIAVRVCEHPRVPVRDDHPGGPPARRVERQEGGGPAGIPAEIGELRQGRRRR